MTNSELERKIKQLEQKLKYDIVIRCSSMPTQNVGKIIIFDSQIFFWNGTEYERILTQDEDSIGTNINVIDTYSNLPPANINSGIFYWVEQDQGTWWLPGNLGGTYYKKGLYYSNGVTWETVPVPYQATQSEVNAGTEPYKFVTPMTLENAAKWNTKVSSVTGSAVDNTDPLNPVITIPTNLTFYSTTAASVIPTYNKLVISLDDPDYNTVAVDVPTGSITTTGQLVGQLVSEPGIFAGNPGAINVTTIGEIRRTSGTGTAEFYFRVYLRNSGGIETLVATSNITPPVTDPSYGEFQTSALLNNGTWTATDRVVIKFYANRIAGGSNPQYNFLFGGSNPVRTLLPVSASLLLNVPIAIGVTGITGGTPGNVLTVGPTGVLSQSSGGVGTQGIQGTQGLTGTGIQGLQGLQGLSGTGIQGLQGIQGQSGTSGTNGTQGTQGTIGTQGQIGIQGSIGLQGTQGTQGVQGTRGLQGLTGTQGSIGSTGAQGTAGIQGITGQTGIQGATGATGSQGIQGTQGTIGIQGTTGSTGVQGAIGVTGAQGIQGTQGTTGSGTQGTQGTVGSQGAQGTQGIQGLSGTGVQGTQGIQGQSGTNGTQGTQGIQGFSTSVNISQTPPVSPNHGDLWFNSDEGQGKLFIRYNDVDSQQWVEAASNGRTGAQGTQGLTGAGLQGTQGVQGVQGLTGVGVQGVQGVQGIQSTQGIQGIAGNVLTLDTTITSNTTFSSNVYANKYIPVDKSTECEITINASVFATNDQIVFEQTGAGKIKLMAGSGMTLNGGNKSQAQYKILVLFFKSATVATIIGGEV